MWNIDLVDKNSVCRNYTETIVVNADGIDSNLPAAAALVKIGRRVSIHTLLSQIETKPQLPQSTGNRIIYAALAIDEEQTKKQH